MVTPHSSQFIDGSKSTDFGEQDARLLEQAAEKLVRFGQQVGVTPEQMIRCSTPVSASKTCWRSLPRSRQEPPRSSQAMW
jgi:hypothetical protein